MKGLAKDKQAMASYYLRDLAVAEERHAKEVFRLQEQLRELATVNAICIRIPAVNSSSKSLLFSLK